LGEIREAVADFERAVQLNPGYVKAHYNLGVAFEELGQMANAERHLRAAVGLEPRSSGLRRGLAGFYLDRGRRADAAAQVEEFLRIDPLDKEVLSWWEKASAHERR
jgi:Flp pilus assembly protein TadD